MTFLERLERHKGGLIRLKTQLWWYDRERFDRSPGRVCLLLGAKRHDTWEDPAHGLPDASGEHPFYLTAAYILLLIDGRVKWVGVAEGDVEWLANF